MRSTGRRFLRIDAAVDERLDPFRATEAAAQLLSYNYRLLGSWPLAITAYNHGAEGVRRAREQLGTDDIVRIVREYHSPSFGFASRNFYVSFLAALSIAQNPEKYFGPLECRSESQFHELKLTAPANTEALVRALGIDRTILRSLNPALRPGVWSGQRPVPSGYILRLPGSAANWTAEALAQRTSGPRPVTVAQLAPGRPSASAQSAPLSAAPATATATATATAMASPASQVEIVPTPPSPLVADNVNTAASPYYLVPANKLMALNSLPDSDYLSDGQRLRLAAAVPEPETVTTAATLQTAQAAVVESVEEQRAVAAASQSAERAEPVSAAQAQAEGPELVPDPVGTPCDARTVRGAAARLSRAAAGGLLRLASHRRQRDLHCPSR